MGADVELDPLGMLANSQALVIRPGDTLVVQMALRLTADHAAQIKTAIEERLPDVKVLVVGCDGLAVYRPDTLAPPVAEAPRDAPSMFYFGREAL